MFQVHGEWQISVENNYILQRFSGCWNKEAAINYWQEFTEKTKMLSEKPWALVSFLDDWDLAIPEAESHIYNYTRSLPALSCSKHCQIYKPSVIKSMQLNKMCFRNNSTYERRPFENTELANLWLESHGFSITTEEFVSSFPTSNHQ